MRTTLILLGTLVALCGFVYFFVWQDPDAKRLSTQLATQPPPAARVQPPTDSGQTPPAGGGRDVRLETIDAASGRIVNDFRAERYDPQPDGTVRVSNPQVRIFQRDGSRIELLAQTGRVNMDWKGDGDDPARLAQQSPTRGTLFDVTITLIPADANSPKLTALIENAEFDTLAGRIRTVDDSRDGRLLVADRVPVIVRGDEYEFDGSGLDVRFNDGAIERLEIAHGRRLLVKNASRFLRPLRVDPPSIEKVDAGDLARALFGELVVTGPTSLYDIDFNDDVKLLADGVEVGHARRMRAVTQLQFNVEAQPQAEPSPQAGPSPRTDSLTRFASRRVREDDERTLEILWTGKLIVTPSKSDVDSVELEGSPATINYDGVDATAAVIRSSGGGDVIELEVSPDVPVADVKSNRNGKPTALKSGGLLLDRAAGTMKMTGPGTLRSVDSAGRRSTLSFAGDGTLSRNDSQQTLTLRDAVRFDSDDATLDAKTLALTFDAGADADPMSIGIETLRSLRADGNAMMEFRRGEKPGKIEADSIDLSLEAHAGTPRPTRLICVGNVRSNDGRRTMTADRLDVSFDATIDSDDLAETMTQADGTNVKLAGADGSRATAAKMRLEPTPDGRVAILEGSPAVVESRSGRIEAADIRAAEDGRWVEVAGAGKLAASDAASGRQLNLSWADAFSAKPSQGVADAKGFVVVRSTSGDSTVDASASALSMTFDPMDPGAPNADFDVNSVRTLDLAGGAIVDSRSTDGRRLRVESSSLHFEPSRGRLDVPQAGRMLLVRPADEAAKRGPLTTAIAWAGAFRYDSTAGLANARDDVRIGIERPDKPDEGIIRLRADTLDATLAPADSTGDPLAESELLGVRLGGAVSVRSNQASFDAGLLDFDATTNIAYARADAGRSVEVFDERGVSKLSFSSLRWNVETGLIDELEDVNARFRR